MPAKGRQPITAKEMEALAKQLRSKAALIQTLAAKIREQEREEIRVMNQPMVERGMNSIDRFILSCKRELGEV